MDHSPKYNWHLISTKLTRNALSTPPRSYGKVLNTVTIRGTFRTFFRGYDGSATRVAVIRRAIETLRELQDVIRRGRRYRMLNSSLLFVLEGDEEVIQRRRRRRMGLGVQWTGLLRSTSSSSSTLPTSSKLRRREAR